MLALQLAARAGDVAALAELAPDFLRQPRVQLGQVKGAAASATRIDLAFAVEQACGHAVAHQLRQQRALHAEDHRGDRIVGGAGVAIAEHGGGAVGVVGSQLALQRRRERKSVCCQHAARQHIERLALLRRADRQQRVAAAARVVAQRAHAADLARQDAGRTSRVAHGITDRTAQHRIVGIGLQRPCLLACQQIARDRNPLLGKGHRVGAEVEHQRLGIDAEEVVFVGAVGQLRLGAARGDALQLGLLLIRGDRLVGVLDGPVIVGAEHGLERRAARLARTRQVDRRVLHHRAGQAIGGGEAWVGELAVGIDQRRAEVVAQAQRVADFVHRHIDQIVDDELLGFGTGRVEVAACFEHVERVRQLLGGEVGVIALRPVLVRRLRRRRCVLAQRIAGLQQASPRREVVAVEHLRTQVAQAARRQAFHADVGVDDLAAARVHLARPDGAEGRLRVGHPAHRRHADVERVEVGVVGLLLDGHRILEADLLEGAVPPQDAARDSVAVLHRHGAVDPERDRLDRLRQLSGRVLLLQTPAVDVGLARRAQQIVGEVVDAGAEVADARIGQARRHRHVGQLGQRVVQAEGQAARVRQRARRRRRRHARRRAGLRHGEAGGVEVGVDVEHHLLGQRADRREVGVARLERITLAVVALQGHAQAEHVAEEKRRGLDQHCLALRVRRTGHLCGAEQAVGKTGGHGAAARRLGITAGVIGVDRHQLHQVVDAAELDQLRAPGAAIAADHRAAVEAGLADALRNLRREEERFVEVFRLQFEPDLFFFLPESDQALRLLGVLDDGGERRWLARRRRCCSGRCGQRHGLGRRGGAGRRVGGRCTHRRSSGRCAAGHAECGQRRQQGRQRGVEETRNGVHGCCRINACNAAGTRKLSKRRCRRAIRSSPRRPAWNRGRAASSRRAQTLQDCHCLL